jgi:uncharacterized membrane protein YcaP (DUF421 family)
MEPKERIIFDGWSGLLEVIVSAPLLYVLVVAAVNISGKRTTGQMNNFDWIVTVAIGSIVASGIVIRTVSVVEAATAATILFGMQWIATRLAVSSDRVGKALKTEPRVLLSRGAFLPDNMKAERITEDEVIAAVRKAGYTDLNEIAWVILENDGQFSIIRREEGDRASRKVVPDALRGPFDGKSPRRAYH